MKTQIEIVQSIFESLDFPNGYTYNYDNGVEVFGENEYRVYICMECEEIGESVYGDLAVSFTSDNKLESVELWDGEGLILKFSQEEINDFNLN